MERIGWITGALGLPITIIPGLLTLRSGHAVTAAAHQAPAPATAEPAEPEPAQILDRDRERAALVTRLTEPQGGVVIVRGDAGVGKTTVVRAALAEVRRRTAGLRVVEHEATPDVRLDVRTLIDDIEAGATPPTREGQSSPARLKASLEHLGDRPVVIVIDSAEHLLNPGNHRLADVDLDEAFEVIAGGGPRRARPGRGAGPNRPARRPAHRPPPPPAGQSPPGGAPVRGAAHRPRLRRALAHQAPGHDAAQAHTALSHRPGGQRARAGAASRARSADRVRDAGAGRTGPRCSMIAARTRCTGQAGVKSLERTGGKR